jgi:hypothetical protein
MYSGTAEKLLHGIGQESCSSPILWALVNQLILTALGETFECITLVSVDKSKISTRPGDSFVDNTTMGVTSDDINSEPVLVYRPDFPQPRSLVHHKLRIT